MFKNENQKSRACIALLAEVHMVRPLWTEKGPTQAAAQALEEHFLSHGETLILKICFDIWNGHGRAEVGDMLGRLDRQNLRRVGLLIAAIADSSDAVEKWIAANSPAPASRLERVKARIADRGQRSGPAEHRFGALILEGNCEGATFIINRHDGAAVGEIVTVEFDPDDQFCKVVEE